MECGYRTGDVMNNKLNNNLGIYSNRSGFTLVETIISLMVFSLLILTFAGTMSVSLRAGKLNGQYAQATSLCQHKIDQMRAVGFGRLNYIELSDAGIIDDYPTVLPFSFAQIDEVGSYLSSATATINIQTVSSTVYKVTVDISWKNVTYGDRRSTMSVTGLIANVE